ncbi:VirK/YbjX family protein [Mucilaginibacter dorajii]|nr:VirK/YbjX family protein [Mucilaginibacter dorajii]
MKKWCRLARVLSLHFIWNKRALSNLKQHRALVQILKRAAPPGRPVFKTSVMYLFSYLSGAITTRHKRKILAHHYGFLRKVFIGEQLSQLYNGGIVFYAEQHEQNQYRVILAPSEALEFEGSLSLVFEMNKQKVASLLFSFAPGDVFDLEDENIVFISCLQRVGNQVENAYAATKYFSDNNMATILLKVLEAAAVDFGITKAICVGCDNQLTAKLTNEHERYYAIYDQFWLNSSGVKRHGDYLIELPMVQKPILLIKQTHRNRTLKKRQRLRDIFEAVQRNLLKV